MLRLYRAPADRRCGMTATGHPSKRLSTFPGWHFYPPVIDRQRAVTCARLLQMQRELNNAPSAPPEPGAGNRCIMRAHRDVIFRVGGAR